MVFSSRNFMMGLKSSLGLVVFLLLIFVFYSVNVVNLPLNIIPSMGYIQDHPLQPDDPLQTYVTAIEEVRMKLISSSSHVLLITARTQNISVMDALTTDDYFTAVNKYASVHTVYLRGDVDYLEHLLAKKYYDYSANNCELLEGKSIYGQHAAKLFYNATCRNDINGSMHHSRSLKYVPLQIDALGGYPKILPDPRIWSFIHIIENAMVDPDGNVLTSEFKLKPVSCQGRNRQSSPGDIYNEVFTITQHWGAGFYHGNLEDLPRLSLYTEFLKKHPDIKIHVANASLTLDLQGINARLVTGNVNAKVLYSPAGGPCGRSPVLTTQLLSMYQRRSLPNISSSRNTIVVIKRSHKRFFIHHISIVEMLERESEAYGLKVEVFPDDPVPDINTTKLMFHNAILVVAPHGAGEANMLYSQSGTMLLEGLCYDSTGRSNLCYRNMAQALGFRYHALIYKKNCMNITADDIRSPVRIILENLRNE